MLNSSGDQQDVIDSILSDTEESDNEFFDLKVSTVKPEKESVSSGLRTNSGENLPLKSVHVRAKLIDMIGQVTIYQEYENTEKVPIEAKYVFPLTDTACVCGFEAFINEKHLVGVCKEKQEARREYRQAIEQGKGAYLMDQESVEMFTINIGNLPPSSRLV